MRDTLTDYDADTGQRVSVEHPTPDRWWWLPLVGSLLILILTWPYWKWQQMRTR